MLEIYNSISQTIAQNEKLSFDTNYIAKGCATTHTAGSSTINLNAPGVYMITFNGVAAATDAATSPIVVSLLDGSTAIGGATSSALSTSVTDLVNLTFNTLIEVKRSCSMVDNTKQLSIQNIGIAAVFNSANLSAIKVL